MSTSVGSIHYELGLETKGFDSAVAGVSSKLNSVGSTMTSVGTKMTLGLTVPIVAGMAYAVKSASDLNETLNKVDVAFKDQAKAVRDWSTTSIKSMGLARQSALDATALFGDMATSMGLNTKEAATMSMSLTQLGADLASFKNISFSEAQTALAGVFTGETESLKRLGIVMTETNLSAYALAKGIKKPIDQMTQAEKVQLRYNYIMEQTKNAQGDFVRTGDSTANQIRKTKENFKELSAQLGDRLLPYVNRFLESMNKLFISFQKLSPKQQDLIIKFALAVAVLGPLIAILGVIAQAIAFLITPVGAVVLAVTLLVAGLAYLEIKFHYIRRILDELNPVLMMLKTIFDWLIQQMMTQLAPIIQFVRDHLDAFKKIAIAVFVLGLIPLITVITMVIGIAMALIGAVTILLRIFNTLVAVTNWVSGTFWNLWSTIARVAGAIIGAMWNMHWQVVSAFHSIVGNAIGAIGSFWGAAYNAGASLVRGIAQGISAMANAPANAMRDVLNRVKNFLPHSPAPEGPFSGKGWTLYSGQSVMQGFAEGINKMADAPRNAIENALASTVKSSQIQLNANQQQAPSLSNETHIHGDIYLQDNSAVDAFMNRLNRNGELTRKGLTVA